MVQRVVLELQGRYASGRTRPLAAVDFTMMQPLAAFDVKVDTTHRPGQVEHVFGDEAGVKTYVGAAAFRTYQLADLRYVQLFIEAPDRAMLSPPRLYEIPPTIGITNHARVVAKIETTEPLNQHG